MSNEKEIMLLKKVERLLNEGVSEVNVIDYIEDELFEYLNLLESYYIHTKSYEADRIVAVAKDDIDVDPELVKERLETIEAIDKRLFISFIENRIKLHK